MPKTKPTQAAAAAAYAGALPKTPSMRTGTELPSYSNLNEIPAGIPALSPVLKPNYPQIGIPRQTVRHYPCPACGRARSHTISSSWFKTAKLPGAKRSINLPFSRATSSGPA